MRIGERTDGLRWRCIGGDGGGRRRSRRQSITRRSRIPLPALDEVEGQLAEGRLGYQATAALGGCRTRLALLLVPVLVHRGLLRAGVGVIGQSLPGPVRSVVASRMGTR